MISKSQITVRYAETDQMGIVHHSVYPIWYEVARTDFCRQAGLPYSKMEEIGVLTPLIDLHCHYRKPAHYEEQLEVRTQISKLSPAKVEFSYEIYQKDDPIPIHTGSTTHALVRKRFKTYQHQESTSRSLSNHGKHDRTKNKK